MKKLMFAIAALTAGFCMADVESANIVGYQNKDFADGFKLIGSPFANCGNVDKKIMLSDVKPTGYLNHEAFQDEECEGTFGDFQAIFLSSTGSASNTIDWNHLKEGGEWIGKGEWGEDCEIAPGQGIWFYAGVWSDEMSISWSGEALLDARNVPVNDGFKPIAIPLARAVSLSEIKVEGYLNAEAFQDEECEGTFGDFQAIVLSPTGAATATVDWNHLKEEGEWIGEGSWGDDYDFEIGDAVWFYAGVWEDGIQLSFPGVED